MSTKSYIQKPYIPSGQYSRVFNDVYVRINDLYSQQRAIKSSGASGFYEIGDRLFVENGVLKAVEQTEENFTTALKDKLDAFEEASNYYNKTETIQQINNRVYNNWRLKVGLDISNVESEDTVEFVEGSSNISIVKNGNQLTFDTPANTNYYLSSVGWNSGVGTDLNLNFERVGQATITFDYKPRLATWLLTDYNISGELGSMAYELANDYYDKVESDNRFDNYRYFEVQANSEIVQNVNSLQKLRFLQGTGIALSQAGTEITITNTVVNTNNYLDEVLWANALPSSLELQFAMNGTTVPNFNMTSRMTDFLTNQYGLTGNLGSMAFENTGSYYTTAQADAAFDDYNYFEVQANSGAIHNVTSLTKLRFLNGSGITVSQTGGEVTISSTFTGDNYYLTGVEWADPIDLANGNISFSVAGTTNPPDFEIFSRLDNRFVRQINANDHTHPVGDISGLGSMATQNTSNYVPVSGGRFTGQIEIEGVLRGYGNGSNSPATHMDARLADSNDSAVWHKYIRNAASTSYNPYYERWYGGNSYVDIGVSNTNLQVNGNNVYHVGNKPSTSDVGAVPSSGGTFNGPVGLRPNSQGNGLYGLNIDGTDLSSGYYMGIEFREGGIAYGYLLYRDGTASSPYSPGGLTLVSDNGYLNLATRDGGTAGRIQFHLNGGMRAFFNSAGTLFSSGGAEFDSTVEAKGGLILPSTWAT